MDDSSEEITTITVKRKTRDRLAKRGLYTDCMDDIVSRLLDQTEKEVTKNG